MRILAYVGVGEAQLELVQLNSRTIPALKEVFKVGPKLIGADMETIVQDALRVYIGLTDDGVKDRQKRFIPIAKNLLKGKKLPFDTGLIARAKRGVSVSPTKPLTVRVPTAKLSPSRMGS